MSGGVDQVQIVYISVFGFVFYLDGSCLDGNTALTLDVHVVEKLLLHLSGGNALRCFQQTVGKRTLAVVNVRDN